jgi:hypothetical protein
MPRPQRVLLPPIQRWGVNATTSPSFQACPGPRPSGDVGKADRSMAGLKAGAAAASVPGIPKTRAQRRAAVLRAAVLQLRAAIEAPAPEVRQDFRTFCRTRIRNVAPLLCLPQRGRLPEHMRRCCSAGQGAPAPVCAGECCPWPSVEPCGGAGAPSILARRVGLQDLANRDVR